MRKRVLNLSGGVVLAFCVAAAESPGAVGFVEVRAQPGLQLIANPLQAPDDRLGLLLPDMKDGMVLYKWVGGAFTTNLFSGGVWGNTNQTLVPGERAFFYNPATNVIGLTFAGTILSGRLTNPVPAGLSIKSSLMPHGRGEGVKGSGRVIRH